MADIDTQLKAAYNAWQAAKRAGDPAAEEAAGSLYGELAEECGDEACIYRGEIHYEHDYGEYECRR